MKYDDDSKIMYVDKLFPGVSSEDIKNNTGFDIDVSRASENEQLLVEEIKILREKIDPLNVYGMR
jgi:glutaconate CoA-transferase subunit B